MKNAQLRDGNGRGFEKLEALRFLETSIQHGSKRFLVR